MRWFWKRHTHTAAEEDIGWTDDYMAQTKKVYGRCNQCGDLFSAIAPLSFFEPVEEDEELEPELGPVLEPMTVVVRGVHTGRLSTKKPGNITDALPPGDPRKGAQQWLD